MVSLAKTYGTCTAVLWTDTQVIAHSIIVI